MTGFQSIALSFLVVLISSHTHSKSSKEHIGKNSKSTEKNYRLYFEIAKGPARSHSWLGYWTHLQALKGSGKYLYIKS